MPGDIETGEAGTPVQGGRMPSPAGRFTVRAHGWDDERTLAIDGELDLASAPKLGRAVATALAGSISRLVLDLRALEFIDASGLHAVLTARDACRSAGCEFALLPGPRHVQRVFEVTGTLSTPRGHSGAEVELP